MVHIKPVKLGSPSLASMFAICRIKQLENLRQSALVTEKHHGEKMYIGVERECLLISTAIPRKGRYSEGTSYTWNNRGIWGCKFEVKGRNVPSFILSMSTAVWSTRTNAMRAGEVYEFNRVEFLMRLEAEYQLRLQLMEYSK